MKEKIFVGSDHRGYALKEYIKSYLEKKGYEVIDKGCKNYDRCDYPDYAISVCKEVLKDKSNIGILFGGTGIGMCITSNKIKGIYAGLVYNEFSGMMARWHNNANVIVIGSTLTDERKARESVNAYLKAKFEGENQKKRVDKIKRVEKEHIC